MKRKYFLFLLFIHCDGIYSFPECVKLHQVDEDAQEYQIDCSIYDDLSYIPFPQDADFVEPLNKTHSIKFKDIHVERCNCFNEKSFVDAFFMQHLKKLPTEESKTKDLYWSAIVFEIYVFEKFKIDFLYKLRKMPCWVENERDTSGIRTRFTREYKLIHYKYIWEDKNINTRQCINLSKIKH